MPFETYDITFGNRYRATSRIGANSVSEVYKGQDLVLNTDVAIQVLLPKYARHENYCRCFFDKAKSVCRISDNPSIASVYDFGQDENGCYLAVEYVEGENLKHMLKRNRILSPLKVAIIASQVCNALQGAHDNGIAHENVRPSHIMVANDGHVKITDFVIPRVTSEPTPYMAPEQTAAGIVTGACDVYALGVVMYEACTGRMPLTNKKQQPLAPSDISENADLDIDHIIMRALEKNPEKRFENALCMKQALDSYIQAARRSPRPKRDYPKGWVLAIIEGSDALKGILLQTRKPALLGRAKDADIRITDPSVSRQHAIFTPCGMYLEVENLSQSNGTFVNGMPLTGKTLCAPGDNLTFGTITARLGAGR